MNLHPCLVTICARDLGTDTRPEDPLKIEALAFPIASDLCNSGCNLTAVREDVRLLLAEDHLAMVALDQACCFDWLQNPSQLAALKRVWSESLAALNVRIEWDEQNPTAASVPS